jgi:membrane fusion protein, multidrug efflux system
MPLVSTRALVQWFLCASTLLAAACGEVKQTPQAAAPPPPAVKVVSVEKKDVTPSVKFNGRVEAVDRVDLLARVEGFVEKRLFEEGADVKAGDLLIVLEKDPYEAQIGQVQGQITAAQGTLRLAEIEVSRQTTLVQREAAAQAKLDEARAKHEQALGELQRLRAALKRSQLDRSYTDIRAPIDGRISRFAFSVGDLVRPSSSKLAVIVSQDPVYVTFPITSRELINVRRSAEASGQDPRAVNVKLRLPDGSIYGRTGTINFVDVQVEPTTDTVIIRATIANPDRLLIPDQLVGVIVEKTRPEQALVIPQAAIAVDQLGPYVLTVDKESKAEQRRIRPASVIGAEIVVAEGLQAGQRVIVEGLQKVRPGQLVQASDATPESQPMAGAAR